jgi:hypothetical protein
MTGIPISPWQERLVNHYGDERITRNAYKVIERLRLDGSYLGACHGYKVLWWYVYIYTSEHKEISVWGLTKKHAMRRADKVLQRLGYIGAESKLAVLL